MSLVTTRYANDIATVTFDDGKANALTFESLDALQETILSAANTASALVLCGRPGVFSAGLDLAIVRSGDHSAVERLIARLIELTEAMMNLPVPVVAACTGHSLAGGAVLLLACDHRVGPESSEIKIGLTEVAVGLALPGYVLDLANRRLDRRVLTRAALMAETVDAVTAASWGYLDELAIDVAAAAASRAQRLVETLDAASFSATKSMMKHRVV